MAKKSMGKQSGEWLRLLLLAFAALFISTSCSVFMLVSILDSARAPNYFPIHANPKPGDFAVYALDGSARRSFILVISDDHRGIQVCQGPVLSTLPRDVTPLYTSFYLKPDGKMIRAGISRGCHHNKWRIMKIAQPGDPGYVKELKRVHNPLIIREKVSTPIGDFIVRDFQVFVQKYRTFMGSHLITCTSLENQQVKFLRVATRCVRVDDAPLVDVIKTLSRLTSSAALSGSNNSKLARMVLSMLQGHKGDNNLEAHWRLVNQGSGGGDYMFRGRNDSPRSGKNPWGPD